MNTNVIRISELIKEKFLGASILSNDLSVFLCGGNSSNDLIFRKQFGNRLEKIKSKYTYKIHYPEDMFIELIFGYYKNDLLTLENLLASWVNVVVILLNSAGTLTELGAFSNHSILKDKLVVIVDQKYEKKRSFINYGPIRYLKNNTSSKVIYMQMVESNFDKLIKSVTDSIRQVAKNKPPKDDLTNPLFSLDFFLALIYVFEPIKEDIVVSIAENLEPTKLADVKYSTSTVISGLVNERKVYIENNLLKVTKQGINHLLYVNKSSKQTNRTLRFLSKLRFEALNLTLRTKYKNIWRNVPFT